MVQIFKEEKENKNTIKNENTTEQPDQDIIIQILENISEEIKDLTTLLK